MKTLILCLVISVSLSAHAATLEKDRGGFEVPAAEGSSLVSLSPSHRESRVSIFGDSARLLFRSLQVEETLADDPFAKVGEIVKRKNNVTCRFQVSDQKYRCDIVVTN